MNRTIFYLHGANLKPQPEIYDEMIFRAIEHGLLRDFPNVVDRFRTVRKEVLYYADLTAQIRGDHDGGRSAAAVERMSTSLTLLSTMSRNDFGSARLTMATARAQLSTRVIGALVRPLDLIGLATPLIARRWPEITDYWKQRTRYRSRIHERLLPKFAEAANNETLVISHSFGNVLAYNVMRSIGGRGRIHTWLSLGSPLPVDSVKVRLDGWGNRRFRGYPRVGRWSNVAAISDLVCADPTCRDDFFPMLSSGHAHAIQDVRVRNPATIDGQHDPHNELGYLMSPQVTEMVAQFLSSPGSQPT